MTRPRRHASSAAASRSHPPAAPTPPPQARGLMPAGFPIGPTRGRSIVVGDVHHRRAVTCGRGKCWRCRHHRGRRRCGRCHCHHFLLWLSGHSRAARRLTRRRGASRRPWRPRRTPPVDAKSALNANHTASRTKLASHAQREKDVPVNFS
jgi:hypothetical protein